MLKKVDRQYYSKIFSMPHFSDWERIKNSRETFLVRKNEFRETYLRYPGFLFSLQEDAEYYDNSFYSTLKNCITPPRGNLTKSSKYIFLGIQPGDYRRHNFQHQIYEVCWYFGPSSEILYKLLLKNKIYPYFTNVYKNVTDQRDQNFNMILKELEIIKNISNNIQIVCMGNYNEHIQLRNKLRKEFNFISIWHPGYLCRNKDNLKLFDKWSKQLCLSV
jgi:hypothetical protein